MFPPASSSAEGSVIKSRVRRSAGPFIIRTSPRFCWPSIPPPKSLRKDGPRTISLQDLIHNHVAGVKGKFILKGISVPSLPPGTWGKFLKAGVRSAIDFALADVAVRYSPAGPREEKPLVRIVIAALAPEPFSLEETARELSRAGKCSAPRKDHRVGLERGGFQDRPDSGNRGFRQNQKAIS